MVQELGNVAAAARFVGRCRVLMRRRTQRPRICCRGSPQPPRQRISPVGREVGAGGQRSRQVPVGSRCQVRRGGIRAGSRQHQGRTARGQHGKSDGPYQPGPWLAARSTGSCGLGSHSRLLPRAGRCDVRIATGVAGVTLSRPPSRQSDRHSAPFRQKRLLRRRGRRGIDTPMSRQSQVEGKLGPPDQTRETYSGGPALRHFVTVGREPTPGEIWPPSDVIPRASRLWLRCR